MIDPKNCKHENYDISWSHGECPRCVDCGMVGEFSPFPNIVWSDDPLLMAVEALNSRNKEATEHVVDYLVLAKRFGFSVYDERLKELVKSK
jgi:hypothetical protein